MELRSNLITITLIFVCSGYLFSQIDSIVAGDFKYQYTSNNKIQVYFDKSTSAVDIGSENSSSWDFSNLNVDEFLNYNITEPANTPFRSDYPLSQFTWEYVRQETQEHVWEFYCYYVSIHLHGLVYTSATKPGYLKKIFYSPIIVYSPLPMKLHASKKDSLVEKTIELQDSDTLKVDSLTIVTKRIVDAYGPITFPGGKTVDALRMKSIQTRYSGTQTEEKLIYQWFTKDGETLKLETDAGSPGNGIVNVTGNIKWMLNTPITNIGIESSAPNQFTLNQNYPNPFNPSTTIKYSIPVQSHVQIKIFNTIGKEIKTLVNEQKSEGTFTTSFIGDDLPSGIYFLRMTATSGSGTFNSQVKMALLK